MVIRATSAEFNEAKPANDDDVMALWAPTAGFADEVTPCVALESHWMFGADTTVNVSFCGSYADDVSSAGVCSCFACMTGSAKELAFIDPEAGRAELHLRLQLDDLLLWVGATRSRTNCWCRWCRSYFLF